MQNGPGRVDNTGCAGAPPITRQAGGRSRGTVHRDSNVPVRALSLLRWVVSPRARAAALMGAAESADKRGDDLRAEIAYLRSVIAMATRPWRRLRDDLLLIFAHAWLFRAHVRSADPRSGLHHGLEAVKLVGRSREHGWDSWSDPGSHAFLRDFLVDLREVLRTDGDASHAKDAEDVESALRRLQAASRDAAQSP